MIRHGKADQYTAKANRIVVRHRYGRVVAIVEIVSPGNKATANEFHAFIKKSVDFIEAGISLLVIDLFPPTKRDPHGIHAAIWSEFKTDDEPDDDLPHDKPLTLASYDAGPTRVAYVEPVAVGDELPDMPIFLRPEIYVPAPLEATYHDTWKVYPAALKGLLQ